MDNKEKTMALVMTGVGIGLMIQAWGWGGVVVAIIIGPISYFAGRCYRKYQDK